RLHADPAQESKNASNAEGYRKNLDDYFRKVNFTNSEALSIKDKYQKLNLGEARRLGESLAGKKDSELEALLIK
ncbi:MAG: hypothetical protein MUF61_01335, partial [archaeon]|nr:hypothetical protein [archaeon]